MSKTETTTVSWAKLRNDHDLRQRLSQIRVLLADRDYRTASLMHRILFSFGFRNIEMVTSGEAALESLRTLPFDLIITEWNMAPVDGITLVKAIRMAKDDERIRRDIPIIMLTARTEVDHVQAARDAGINEFVRKPFSAQTISKRIIQVIDTPRVFVESPVFVGPCRRRRGDPPMGQERRAERKASDPSTQGQVIISPGNSSLRDQLEGAKASEILTEAVVAQAQEEVVKAEAEFISWAADDVALLEDAYVRLDNHHGDLKAQGDLMDAAYRIKSQAGIFGFDIGTEVAGLLVKFLTHYETATTENLVIVRKHIDAIRVIFSQKIKGDGEKVGADLIASLRKLIMKLG